MEFEQTLLVLGSAEIPTNVTVILERGREGTGPAYHGMSYTEQTTEYGSIATHLASLQEAAQLELFCFFCIQLNKF